MNDELEQELMLQLSRAEQQFNRKREQLRNRTEAYFRQGIRSDYISEESLINLLNECSELKDRVRVLRSLLIAKPK